MVGNKKLKRQGDLQWHDVHTKFYENPSVVLKSLGGDKHMHRWPQGHDNIVIK
jgi:hypothetical protein